MSTSTRGRTGAIAGELGALLVDRDPVHTAGRFGRRGIPTLVHNNRLAEYPLDAER